MAPRFDPGNRRLELAVADLIDAQLLARIGFAARGGFERLWLGQALHTAYQRLLGVTDTSFQSEHPIRVELAHRGWTVGISGRIDGLRRAEDGSWVIEELKTVRRLGQLKPEAREVFESQLRLYAWMFAKRDAVPVRAELVLISMATHEIERIAVDWHPQKVEVSVRNRIEQLLAGFEREREAREQRRQAVQSVRFPHPHLRPGQPEIIATVERALAQKEHLLLQAPTGIGKTAAVLWPAIRSVLAEDRRLFILTAKTLQQRKALEVVHQLGQGTGLFGIQLRAKARMCANSELLCYEDYCPYARDYWGKLSESNLLVRLQEQEEILDPDTIFQAARSVQVCPFEVSLDLQAHAHCVIADYNYAFDPYVALPEFHSDSELSNTVLVIDEVHNLVDRSRGYLSPALDASLVMRARQVSHELPTEISEQLCSVLENLLYHLEHATECLPSGANAAALSEFDEVFFFSLRPDLDEAFVDYLEYRRETASFRSEDPFVELYFRYLRFLGGFAHRGKPIDEVVERRNGVPVLRFFAKDASSWLQPIFSRVHAVIGFSATLSPFEFYRDLLGLDRNRFVSLTVESPFPRENLLVIVDCEIDTRYRSRSEQLPQLTQRLTGFLESVVGNCLVLFPSYEYLQQVAERLRLKTKRVYIQQPIDTPEVRDLLLEALASPLTGPAAVLAVAGGVFAEGVDYPGDMLAAVAVVSPCLPVPSLDLERLQEYYESRFEKGFEYAYVVPGMTRVVQAGGRLIRSEQDRGVVVLFDPRFCRKPFRSHLPKSWLDPQTERPRTGDPVEAVRAFFHPSPKEPLVAPSNDLGSALVKEE